MNQEKNLSDLMKPPFRKLRGYAFDPSLSLKIDTAAINDIVYRVPWEDDLKVGPTGEYLEVIDFDPTVNKFYMPVNLNSHYTLAQDGLNPSESNPQFHQQMVYAVAMTTITNFEKALGRKVLWGQRITSGQNDDDIKKDKDKYDYTQRLRIYPHAFRDANAFYSPQKKALLFGYFYAQPSDITVTLPNALVFTCLSHDIIAHETTHAILDGMFRNYIDSSNPDVLAFHEAFADIVALFQHFTFSDVLKNQIARTKGDLNSQNLLGQLAQEFGAAIGNYGSLRDAIGGVDPKTKKWVAKEPNGNEYQTILEPHQRGSILVSAVFEAFLTIYKSRIADLLRIASNGTGILPQGELHPDLVNRMADEAAKSAGHILKMCIRALDYCPPVDINFGDYLRAIITADADLVEDDDKGYRLAFIDAFRKRGIYPTGIRTLSVESLQYSAPKLKGLEGMDFYDREMTEANYMSNTKNRASVGGIEDLFTILTIFLRDFSQKIVYAKKREEIFKTTHDFIAGNYDDKENIIFGLHRRIKSKFANMNQFEILTGLIFYYDWKKLGVKTSKAYSGLGPSFEVQTLKLASRVGPSGNQLNQIIITLVQKVGIESVEELDGKWKANTYNMDSGIKPGNGFEMKGGCTLIFDLDTLKLKYAISKPLLDIEELKRKNGKHIIDGERAAMINPHGATNRPHSLYEQYFNANVGNACNEPFSFLHAH
jgi:hypothetical protein